MTSRNSCAGEHFFVESASPIGATTYVRILNNCILYPVCSMCAISCTAATRAHTYVRTYVSTYVRTYVRTYVPAMARPTDHPGMLHQHVTTGGKSNAGPILTRCIQTERNMRSKCIRMGTHRCSLTGVKRHQSGSQTAQWRRLRTYAHTYVHRPLNITATQRQPKNPQG